MSIKSIIRSPEIKDGQKIYDLVNSIDVLDTNSEYAYLLLSSHFKDTCAVSLESNNLIGFVGSYLLPAQQDTLFIWQVAVHPDFQKQGIAYNMVKHILERYQCQSVKYINATVAPSNNKSRKFFASLARDLNTSLHEQSLFSADDFSNSHEDEPLIVVGPIV